MYGNNCSSKGICLVILIIPDSFRFTSVDYMYRYGKATNSLSLWFNHIRNERQLIIRSFKLHNLNNLKMLFN